MGLIDKKGRKKYYFTYTMTKKEEDESRIIPSLVRAVRLLVNQGKSEEADVLIDAFKEQEQIDDDAARAMKEFVFDFHLKKKGGK